MSSLSPIRMLLVTDDPALPRQFERLLGPDHAIEWLFADTANAISRAFAGHPIDLVVLFADDNLADVLDAVTEQVRKTEPPTGLIGVIDPENAVAGASLARIGVDGLVDAGNERRLRGLLLRQAELLRAADSARKAEQRLAEIEDRYTLLLDSSSEAIAYLHEGLHVFANPAYLELFGYADFEEIESLSMLDLLESTGDGLHLREVLKGLARDQLPGSPLLTRAWRADGSEFGAVVSFSRARYGGEACVQMLVHEDRPDADPALAEELRRIKQSDQLTGLLNHAALREHLGGLLDETSDNTSVALLMMSVDDHEKIQSRVGIGASDQLVCCQAEMFTRAAGEELAMARLRDHVFAVIVDSRTEQQADQISRRIVERCQGQVLEVNDLSLPITVSVGVTQGSSGETSAESLIAQADMALSEALRSGGNAYVRYRPRVSPAAGDDDLVWGERLVHAIDHDEIQLLSTAISSMEEDDFIIHEIETRLRAQDSEEVVMPSVFLAAAQRLGLAARLDQDQLHRLGERLQDMEFSRDDLWMVTLSMQSATDAEFCDHLQSLMEQNQLPARQMIWAFREFEVRDQLRQTQDFIRRFGPLGCRFAVCEVAPDSAAGPTLQFLELDFVSLAPEMIQSLGDSEETRQQLSTIVAEAGKNHVRVIAPKVDDTADLATLWQLGITLVQGEFVRE